MTSLSSNKVASLQGKKREATKLTFMGKRLIKLNAEETKTDRERGSAMSFSFEPSQLENRRHQLLLNLFASFKRLTVFNEAKKFLQSKK